MKKLGDRIKTRSEKVRQPNFWTERIIPIDDGDECDDRVTTVRSIRFADSDQVHEYSKGTRLGKERINCMKGCRLI